MPLPFHPRHHHTQAAARPTVTSVSSEPVVWHNQTTYTRCNHPTPAVTDVSRRASHQLGSLTGTWPVERRKPAVAGSQTVSAGSRPAARARRRLAGRLSLPSPATRSRPAASTAATGLPALRAERPWATCARPLGLPPRAGRMTAGGPLRRSLAFAERAAAGVRALYGRTTILIRRLPDRTNGKFESSPTTSRNL